MSKPWEPFDADELDGLPPELIAQLSIGLKQKRKKRPMTMCEYYHEYTPDVTPESHPDHHVVGREFGGHDWQARDDKGKRWFCYSHDAEGYNMYCTDGSGHWTNISERAIGRSFHEIHKDPDGRVWCSWFSGPVPRYTQKKMVLIDPATGLRTNV